MKKKMKKNKNSIILLILLVIVLIFSGCNQKNNFSTENIKNIDGQLNSSMPPSIAIDACIGKVINDECEFKNNDDILNGICDDKPGILACAPTKTQESKINDSNKKSKNLNTQEIELNSSKYNYCILNTKDNPECKDCCDCLTDTDGTIRTACRDKCATHDFIDNSNFITITTLSTLGENGNYSQCTNSENSQECKICCESSMELQCGDYRYCRTACNNVFEDSIQKQPKKD